MTTENWKEEWRDYFDKCLKPKKPTMANLDREISVNFIERLLTRQTTELREKIEYLGQKVNMPEELQECERGWGEACDKILSLLEPDT